MPGGAAVVERAVFRPGEEDEWERGPAGAGEQSPGCGILGDPAAFVPTVQQDGRVILQRTGGFIAAGPGDAVEDEAAGEGVLVAAVRQEQAESRAVLQEGQRGLAEARDPGPNGIRAWIGRPGMGLVVEGVRIPINRGIALWDHGGCSGEARPGSWSRRNRGRGWATG